MDHRDEKLNQMVADIADLRRDFDKLRSEFLQVMESGCNLDPLVDLIRDAVETRDRKIADLERQLKEVRS